MTGVSVFGSTWRQMICRLDRPSARAALTYSSVAVAQELGAHVVREADPAEQRQQNHEQHDRLCSKIDAKMISR